MLAITAIGAHPAPQTNPVAHTITNDAYRKSDSNPCSQTRRATSPMQMKPPSDRLSDRCTLVINDRHWQPALENLQTGAILLPPDSWWLGGD